MQHKYPAIQASFALKEFLTIKAGEDDQGGVKVEGLAYGGGKLILKGFDFPVVVDLEGMEIPESIPLLADHENKTGSRVGVVSAAVTNGTLTIDNGEILSQSDLAKDIVSQAESGAGWQLSIGANPGRGPEDVQFVREGSLEINGQMHEAPFYHVVKSKLEELSIVPVGADTETHLDLAASFHFLGGYRAMNFPQWLESHGLKAADLTAEQTVTLQAAYDKDQVLPPEFLKKDPVVKPVVEPVKEPVVAPVVAAAATPLDIQAAVDLGHKNERERIASIQAVCSDEFKSIEAKAIMENWDLPKTTSAVLAATREARPNVNAVNRSASNETQIEEAQAIEAALCMSFGGISEKKVGEDFSEKVMNAAVSKEMRGYSLHELMYRTIKAAGVSIAPGRMNNDTIRAALSADLKIQAAGGFSTISLTGILSNLANKTMLDAYNAVESVVSKFTSTADMTDFKTATSYRMTGVGIFEEVGPGGEIKHGQLSEEEFTNQVLTYGKMLALTRQDLINDDLGALLRIARVIGRMAALKLEETVFTLLLSNPSSFYSAANLNLLTGATSVLDIDALTLGEALFLDQVDSDGKPILISPAVLLVPTTLKVTAQQLMTETRVNETTTADAPQPANNPHVGKWEPVSSPYLNSQALTGQSDTAWYLFGNPSDVSSIEIGYLRGQRVPTIENSETDFNTLGMQWRGFFDFGVAMQDHRGSIKSDGA